MDNNFEEKVKSIDNIYAGFWIRLASLLLDVVFFLPVPYIFIFINSFGKNVYFYTLLPHIIFGLWYNVYLVKKYGGTPGKLVVGIKIFKLNTEPVNWREAILRYSVSFGLAIFGSIVMIIAILKIDETHFDSLLWWKTYYYMESLSPILFKVHFYTYYIWIFSELIVLLTNKKKRGIQDYIAKTVIVKTKYIDIFKKGVNKTDNENIESKIEIHQEKNAPTGLYILSGFSFIPAIGVIFGVISIIISFFNFRRFRIIFILGLSGIIFSIVIYSTLFYFGMVQRGGVYDNLRVELSRTLLNNISRELVNYKCRYGKYPDKLEDILKDNAPVIIYDPISNNMRHVNNSLKFYYKAEKDTFILFSVGVDRKPFTKDDIYPGESKFNKSKK